MGVAFSFGVLMPTTQTQLRRGTASQNAAMTPAEGEVIVDLTNDRLSLGDGLTPGGRPQASAADVQSNKFTYITVAGTNTLTSTVIPSIGSYSEGQGFQFKAVSNNTGATTLNLNAIGAIALRKDVSGTLTALVADDIRAGIVYDVIYNGSTFQLMNNAAAAPVASGLVLLGTSTGTGAGFEFNGLFSSAYSSYELVLDNVKPSTGGTTLSLQFRAGGSYITTAVYQSAVTRNGVYSNSGTAIIVPTAISTGTGVCGVGQIVLNAGVQPRMAYHLSASDGTNGNESIGTTWIRQTITADGVRVIFSGGTASGRALLYGRAV